MRNLSGFGIRDSGFEVGIRMRNLSGLGIRDSGFEFGMRDWYAANPKAQIPNPESQIPNPASMRGRCS